MIDYDTASITYDNTRTSDERVFCEFGKKVDFGTIRFLDFGCGTGNYLTYIAVKTGNCGFGVEPSSGMRENARRKNPQSDIREGSHECIPYGDGHFDFIYMTDVIHHVPDLGSLFGELYRVLGIGGLVCIVTQSWKQIEARWYNRYFPSLSANEKNRYPDIATIVESAAEHDLRALEVVTLESNPEHVVSAEFIRNVEEKNFSMFRMLTDGEFQNGLANLKSDNGKSIASQDCGESLVWLKKGP